VFTITFCKRPLADAREVVVVQLQLLDLMIPKECGAVPMGAATRADLIDLMARVLVAVFHEEGGRVNDRGPVPNPRLAVRDSAGFSEKSLIPLLF
jgi:hypothetical protein